MGDACAQRGQGAEVGLLSYAADFFATNEREIAFTKWLQVNRPDITPADIRRTAAALAYWRRVYYGSLPTTGMEYPADTTLTLTGLQVHNQKETEP